MGEWIRVDPDEFDLRRKRRFNNVEINVLVSPYDVPERVRGAFDNSLNRFVIEFQYMGDEPWRCEAPDPHMTLRVGRNSNRLYGIEVDVHGLRAKSVTLNLSVPDLVNNALESQSRRSDVPRENYDLARQLISRRGAELFSGAR